MARESVIMREILQLKSQPFYKESPRSLSPAVVTGYAKLEKLQSQLNSQSASITIGDDVWFTYYHTLCQGRVVNGNYEDGSVAVEITAGYNNPGIKSKLGNVVLYQPSNLERVVETADAPAIEHKTTNYYEVAVTYPIYTFSGSGRKETKAMTGKTTTTKFSVRADTEEAALAKIKSESDSETYTYEVKLLLSNLYRGE